MWKAGDLIYDVTDPDKNMLPADHPSDQMLRFNSRFESGNLHQAYYLQKNTYHLILEFDHNSSGACQWFYFQMKNVKKDIKYTFFISGFHKKKSLFTNGGKVFLVF